MFGRLKKWLSGQPKKRRWPAPDEVTTVIKGLPEGSRIVSYKYWQMGWQAEVAVGRRRFGLFNDRGYTEVCELVESKRQPIAPPEDQRTEITPEQIRRLILGAIDHKKT